MQFSGPIPSPEELVVDISLLVCGVVVVDGREGRGALRAEPPPPPPPPPTNIPTALGERRLQK